MQYVPLFVTSHPHFGTHHETSLIPLSRQIASKYGVAVHAYPAVQLLPADALGDWRQHMLAKCAPFIEPPLERFVAQVFAIDAVVEAYSLLAPTEN